MSYGEEVVQRRSGRISSRDLALRTGISPGRVWAIEHDRGKPPTEAERVALDNALNTLASETSATRTTSAARRVTRVATTSTTPRPANTTELIRQPSLSRAAVGVDWSSLRRAADTVSDHDFERITEGPDPTAGYRLFSNSEIASFTQCPRRWWLAYHRKLTPKHESPLGPLNIGDRIHRALRLYYVPPSSPAVDPRESIENIIKTDWARIERRYEPGDPQLDALKTKFAQESDLERVMLEGYVEWLVATGADEYLTTVGSEMYAECEFDAGDDTPVKLIGKLDARVQRASDGVTLFIDHKTVANFTTPRATLHMNPQMLHYDLIVHALMREGERCDGALYNMLRKTFRTNRTRPPYFERVEVRHNPHTLDSYAQRLRVIINQILDIEMCLNDGADFKKVIHHNPVHECAWRCPFFSVCPMFDDSKSYPEGMLQEYYTKHDTFGYYYSPAFTEETE